MSEFVVHSLPASPFGRAVLATLVEKGANYRLCLVPPDGLRAQPHLSRHPFGRAPVLEHGSFSLYETAAILRYLDRVLANPPLTPSDPKAAARMDQVMSISDWYLFQDVVHVIAFERIVAPRYLGRAADEAAIADAMPNARVVVRELARLLANKPNFAGDDLSLADLLVGSQLDFLAETPEWTRLAGESERLVAWLERVRARPSMRATTWARLAQMTKAA